MDGTAHKYNEESIVAHFKDWDLDEESAFYLRFHARRYLFLIDQINHCRNTLKLEGAASGHRMLDVGPSVFTQFLRDKKMIEDIDSLGFHDHRILPRENDTHLEYNLNHSIDPATWPEANPYDVIVMAEVIEHLPICPSHIFNYFSRLLKPQGFLIIQTPNACSFPKRLRMLRGQNPYELIRESQHNPGHFREYTVKELSQFAQDNGFGVHSVSTANYFLRETLSSRAFRSFEKVFPSSLRDGITICLRKQGDA